MENHGLDKTKTWILLIRWTDTDTERERNRGGRERERMRERVSEKSWQSNSFA